MALSLVAASASLCATTAAYAGGSVALTDNQLDRVTAAQGGPAALVNAGASASGLFAAGGTQTTAVTEVGDSPFGGSGAQVVGVAFGVGRNGVMPGQSSAAVSTFTEAPGNVVVNIGWNRTFYGLGLTAQVGVSSSVADLIPGMP